MRPEIAPGDCAAVETRPTPPVAAVEEVPVDAASQPDANRRGLPWISLVAGLVIVVAGGCGSAASVSPTPEEPAWSNGTVELRIGDCFQEVLVAEGDPFDAEVVSCSSPHDGEVVPGGCAFTFEGLSPDVRQEAVAAFAQYVGIEEESEEAMSDWLVDNGLAIYANWSVSARPQQCVPFLTAEEGDLSRSYRVTNEQ